MRPGRNWATKEQTYLWQTGSSSDKRLAPPGRRASGPERGPPGSFTLRFLLLFYCCMWHGCSGYGLYYVMCCCVFGVSALVVLHCFVLCHIIDHVIVMLVSACVCFFMLVHLLWSWAWLWIFLFFEFSTSVIWGRVCRFHFNMLVLMFQYYLVLFVVVVIVSRCCYCWLCINICWRRARCFASRFKFAMPEKSRARAGDLFSGCWRFICCIRLVQFGSSCSPWLWFCSFSLCFFCSI